MAERPLQEGLLTANRISELHENPVQGNFDTAHLKEVHRRIFQDLPHHAPGEFRPDAPGHNKMRELESGGRRHVVGYARGNEIQAHLDRTFGELQGGKALQGLPPEQFAERMAKLYGDLDHIHPFREGNSRTLREFTRELAQHAGYELDWHSTGADAQARDRLYVARDREVLERLYPNLDEARSMVTESRQEYEAYFVLERLRQGDSLRTIIQENATPRLQLQADPLLRGLGKDDFARDAAQRLSVTVQAQDMTPAQVREAAAQLGREAERPLNLEVITGARLSRDTLEARQGDSQGFTRMFQEASDPASCKLLKQAADNLQQRGIDPDRLYLTVARPGETHEGRLEFKTTRVGVVSNDQGQHLATPAASLKGVAISDGGRVQFTAREPAKVQRQMDY